jgi:hypothetical protein
LFDDNNEKECYSLFPKNYSGSEEGEKDGKELAGESFTECDEVEVY